MTETTRLTTFLPGFGGFHGTQWANLFPFALEMCAERFARYEAADELTAADLGAILRETSDAFFARGAGARAWARYCLACTCGSRAAGNLHRRPQVALPS